MRFLIDAQLPPALARWLAEAGTMPNMREWVTIQGRPLNDLLCHSVLTYSNWERARRCQSESLLRLAARLAGKPAALWPFNT